MGSNERGQRLYNWWSTHRGAFGVLYGVAFLGREREFRRRSVEALDLESGDRVLELGCGPGNSLGPLRRAVGEDGSVLGVDYSAGMVAEAAERIRTTGWENVHAVRGDVTRLGTEAEAFDAVYAAMSLSATADPDSVLREAADCLCPGGRIAVLDARPFQDAPWTALNPIIVPVSKAITNWYPDGDIPGALRRRFESVATRSYNAGTVFVASARKPGPE